MTSSVMDWLVVFSDRAAVLPRSAALDPSALAGLASNKAIHLPLSLGVMKRWLDVIACPCPVRRWGESDPRGDENAVGAVPLINRVRPRRCEWI
jgi:hypothetical protein